MRVWANCSLRCSNSAARIAKQVMIMSAPARFMQATASSMMPSLTKLRFNFWNCKRRNCSLLSSRCACH